MKRTVVIRLLSLVLLSTLACNIPVALGTQKMTPQRWDTSGDRIAFSAGHSCEGLDTVILIIDENGVAHLSTTGPVYVDYINCLLDPSGFRDTYDISGIADPESKLITFTSCNEGGFDAEGTISYQDGKPIGNVTCKHISGDEAGQPAMTVWVPAGNP
jgi:hypothetical protein